MKSVNLKLYLAMGFIVVLAIFGGSSRADAFHQIPLRLIALGLTVAALWTYDPRAIRRHAPLFAIVIAATLLPALQLVPLPPGLWASLPGRGFYQEIIDGAGLLPTWRPLSFTPETTLNSLLAMTVPLAMLVLVSQLEKDQQRLVAYAFLALAFIGLALGYAQIAQGPDTGLRHYRPTNADAMVGLFPNRNHHALMLAYALPMLCLFAVLPSKNRSWEKARLPLCLIAILIVAATILAAGSRAGLIIGLFGLLAGALLAAWVLAAYPNDRALPKKHSKARPKKPFLNLAPRIWAMIAAGVAALALGLIVLFGNYPAIERLWRSSPIEEQRFRLFDPIMALLKEMWVLGSGFGSFDTMFRRFEINQDLATSYVNNAHNDFLQLAIEGGIPALLIAGAFAVWWVSVVVGLWRQRKAIGQELVLAWLGAIITGMAMIGSLVDYPLRTPMHAAIFVTACCWMQLGRGKERRERRRLPRTGARRLATEGREA